MFDQSIKGVAFRKQLKGGTNYVKHTETQVVIGGPGGGNTPPGTAPHVQVTSDVLTSSFEAMDFNLLNLEFSSFTISLVDFNGNELDFNGSAQINGSLVSITVITS